MGNFFTKRTYEGFFFHFGYRISKSVFIISFLFSGFFHSIFYFYKFTSIWILNYKVYAHYHSLHFTFK